MLPEWARARALERLAGRLVGGVLTIAASEQRSQLANRQAARVRLADLLRDAIAPPPRPRVPTRPGRAANERRLQAKRSRAAVKRTRRYDDRHPDLARRTTEPGCWRRPRPARCGPGRAAVSSIVSSLLVNQLAECRDPHAG